MSRNNQRRLNSVEPDQDPPNTSTKSPLDFVMPTEHVELPTQGKFYPVDHPLHNTECVEIRYMTAKETDLLTSKTLLKKGIAVDRMLQNIIIDKNIKINDLYVGDKNALVIAARVSGFGNEYDTSVTCPQCSTINENSFDLNDFKVKEPCDDIEITPEGTFFVRLPNTNINVECRLITAGEEKGLLNLIEKKEKLKLGESPLTDQIKSFVVSCEGITERGLVEDFIDVMPARDSNHLRKEYNRVRPDINLQYPYECETCSATSQVTLPFSTSFFWPDR
jgi:hypothetical protein